MYNKVKIHQINADSCVVQAIAIKKNNENLLIPSPFGVETMLFNTVEEAIAAVKKAGYEYYISKSLENNSTSAESLKTFEPINYDSIIEVFIKNLGHENLEIRNSAIKSLSKFGLYVSERLINLIDDNHSWLTQQSAIKCMENILTSDKNAAQIFLTVLIAVSNSENTMIRSSALKALERICDNRFE